ncbi:MAG: hypothetical protein LBK77_05385 [Spirochaetaceae bacterium]|nr:hypothetical protein [Spirochaetaceae bacterium]
MNKRNVFLVLCAALLTASLAGCAEPAPEDIEDFGEKTKVSKVFTVSNTDEWAAAVKAIDGGGNDRNYVVNVTGPVDIPGLEGSTFSRPHSGVNISLRGTAPDAALVLSGKGSLIVLGEGEHLVLRDITLKGGEGNTAMLVYVGGGSTLTMKAGAEVSGNSNRLFNTDIESVRGGGVHVAAGAVFTMQGGIISGNYDDGGYGGAGGGVYMAAGAVFTMEGGEISGNTSGSVGTGGGVYMTANAVFTMEGGEISGNTSDSGGGVCVDVDEDGGKGTFIMRGGTISGNEAFAGNHGAGGAGGGVSDGTFSLTGGIVHGSDGGDKANEARQGASLYRDGGSAVYGDGSPIARGRAVNGTLTGR